MSLDLFLKKFIAEKGAPVNYTKIGSPEHNVFGNRYFIPDDRIPEFYKVYKKYVFKDKKEAYLTEKQHDIGKILIDLDFRYNENVEERQHTQEHIEDFIELCLNAFNELFENIREKHIKFYIFEKDNLRFCDNDVVKDGIHIIINVECDFAVKMMLREYLVENIADIWDDLPITNTWSDVIDEGVMKGHVNWQLYGSRKPGCESYKLKYIYDTNLVEATGEMVMKPLNVLHIDFDKEFPMFCARNKTNLIHFKLSAEHIEKYDKYKSMVMTKQSKKSGALKTNRKTKNKGFNTECMFNIRSEEELDHALECLFEDTNTNHRIKEIHRYTMCLPKEYWGPASYDKWIRVGWALRNTDYGLYLTWLKMSCQSEDFDWNDETIADKWMNFDVNNEDGLTARSIMYWAKQSNPTEYDKVHRSTIDYHVYYSFHSKTEWDLALTLSKMYKAQFVCASIEKKMWFQFSNNRWVPTDTGRNLRMNISTEMYDIFAAKAFEYQSKIQASQNNISSTAVVTDNDASEQNKQEDTGTTLNAMEKQIMDKFKTVGDSDGSFEDYKKKVKDMYSTTKLLKKTSIKQNIMRESMDLFSDPDFMNKLDKDPYILGCSNCVIDFREKRHRQGKPDDYIQKSTNVQYKPLSYYETHSPNIIKEIDTFFEQLFPDISLRNYVWEHLASTLLGTNKNQTFNIYNGTGANGKSKLVELMSQVLGDYKGTVPISLVTQKRSNIGGTSSEVYNLIGTRYAVMQEPSKGDRINEGIMKELTGGDPIQCRALFKDSVTFIPQFKLVVCTNTLFDVPSHDDGTWRRLRIVEFKSKFTDKPYTQFPREDYPYQYEIDTKIDEKFKYWVPVLLAKLVNIAYRTQGHVNDVDIVLEATNAYRKEQDVLQDFTDKHIMINPNPDSKIILKSQDIVACFSTWYKHNYADTKAHSGNELTKYLTKRFGKMQNGGWTKIMFIPEMDDENDIDC
jgi:P4 family phage/plasmid primase-like protien